MKKRIPLVSVLINNYNKEKFCFKAVKSVLKQSYHKVEIIFFDDFSEDQSLSKIKKIILISFFKNGTIFFIIKFIPSDKRYI